MKVYADTFWEDDGSRMDQIPAGIEAGEIYVSTVRDGSQLIVVGPRGFTTFLDEHALWDRLQALVMLTDETVFDLAHLPDPDRDEPDRDEEDSDDDD